jgi:hypothetical protein
MLGIVSDPIIFFDDGCVRAGSWCGALLEFWTAVPTPQLFRDLSKRELAYAATQPDRKMAMVSIVQMSKLASISSETRKELDIRTAQLDAHLRASLILVPAQGFLGSIVRGVMTGQMLLSRNKVPSLVSSAPREGVAWLAPHLPALNGRPIAADDLYRAYEAVVTRSA